jgi:crotonobetainyl-CoA:carnitine CoA-transferase CaiB-like acyl-CoA transferase
MTPGTHADQPREAAFLSGVRVVELTTALAGPYATTILADLGAEVIKVEGIDGDSMRQRRGAPEEISLPFAMIHRNKSSLAVDLKDPRGREAARRVIDTADVLVENFRPGVVARLGLDYEAVKATNPAIVYCSVSGFGQTGPLSPLGGVDLIAQGFGGLMSVTGFSAAEPAKAGYPVSDFGTGMWGAIGVLAALARKAVTGQGAYIDVSLAECVASWSLWEVADWQARGEVPEPLGTAHRLAAPYQGFACKDGRFVNVAATGQRWGEFCEVTGAPQLRDDPRFANEVLRYSNRLVLAELLGRQFALRDRDEWIKLLRDAKIPCGPINSIPEMLADEHLAVRQLFEKVRLGEQDATVVRTPVVAAGAPRVVRQPPELGADTRALLGEAGYADDEIAGLARDAVIAYPSATGGQE